MNKIINYLNLITIEVDTIKKNHESVFDSNLLIGFRGEEADFGQTSLMPSLFRDSSFIQKEKYLFELMCDYGVSDSKKNFVDQAIDAQHYIAISRMLDISFSALVGLYFACQPRIVNDEVVDEDGYLFIFGFPEYYSPHSGYVEEFYRKTLAKENNIMFNRNFKVFTHSHSNERIIAQHGGFIFFPGKEFHKLDKVYYTKICVKQGDKKDILDTLDMLFQINKASVFPEKSIISEIVKEKFKKTDYYVKEQQIKYEVDASLDRIEYELAIGHKESTNKSLRKLRNEKKDLLCYIDSCYNNIMSGNQKSDEIMNEKEALKDKIENCFIIYKARLGRK